MLQLNAPILITYGILTLTLACLWIPRSRNFPILTRWIWLIPFLAATLLGLHYDFLQPIAVASILSFGLACFAWAKTWKFRRLKWVSGSVVLALTIALFLHAMPGFDNPKIISGLKLSPEAIPYNKFLNFDSALIGLGIIGFGFQRLSGVTEWLSMLKRVVPFVLLTLLAVMLLSLWLGYVNWQPKATLLFFAWAWGNLFFTCIAEEAFFRGFIQKSLMLGLANFSGGTAIALLISSAVFGLAHMAGGPYYVILATVAGIGYGWAYHRTQRIEASILTHFTLNSLHFIFFTYPALISAFA